MLCQEGRNIEPGRQYTMQDLKITLIQTALHWGDAEANLRHFDHLFEGIRDSDLVILPEMFNTGFITEPGPVAETMDGHTMRWLREKASALDAAIVGSLIIKDDGNYYNRLVFMFPDGSFQRSDKRHLFSMAGEHHRFSQGTDRNIIRFKGWNILSLVCYDLRFPVWSKNTWDDGQYGYDLLIYIANWPEMRSHAWKSLLPARAIENIAYTAAVNRVGNDGRGQAHSGDSAVIDPKGNMMLSIEPHQEAVQTVTLSKKVLTDYREAFNVGPDWDRVRV